MGYDQLVSRFVSSTVEQFPCVGNSLGFERIFSYLKNTKGIGAGVSTDVLICELSGDNKSGLGLYKERMRLLNELRSSTGLNVEIVNKIAPSFRDQINYAEQREIKWMVIIGDEEIENGTVNLRRLTLVGDTIVTKDGKEGEILEVVTLENSKWPQFRVRPAVSKSGKGKNEWMLNKKQMKGIVQNGVNLDMQTKGLPRNELIAFF